MTDRGGGGGGRLKLEIALIHSCCLLIVWIFWGGRVKAKIKNKSYDMMYWGFFLGGEGGGLNLRLTEGLEGGVLMLYKKVALES